MVGSIVLSPSDAVGQKAVVGSAQHVVMARARAPRDATVQHRLQYFGFQHPDLKLEGGAQSVVQFEGILPEAAPGVRIRRSTSMDRSAWWLTFSPRYTNSCICLYT